MTSGWRFLLITKSQSAKTSIDPTTAIEAMKRIRNVVTSKPSTIEAKRSPLSDTGATHPLHSHGGYGVALFVSRPSKVPFIENKISLIEFTREKFA